MRKRLTTPLALSVLLLGLAVPALAQPAAAEERPGLFSRLGAALDRGVVAGRNLVAEGAEAAGRGLQRAGEATNRAAEEAARQLRTPDAGSQQR